MESPHLQREGQAKVDTGISWKSFKIHLVEVYLIKIVFLMVCTVEEEDPVVSNQSNLDFIKVEY